MSDSNRQTAKRGAIPRADRLQRLIIGGTLMVLTIYGLFERFEWRAILALCLQIELLVTGIAGWCPMYWACRIAVDDNL